MEKVLAGKDWVSLGDLVTIEQREAAREARLMQTAGLYRRSLFVCF